MDCSSKLAVNNPLDDPGSFRQIQQLDAALRKRNPDDNRLSVLLQLILIEEAADQLRQASRRYAKRQLTWFKRNPQINWLTRQEGDSADEILQRVRQVIRNFDN